MNERSEDVADADGRRREECMQSDGDSAKSGEQAPCGNDADGCCSTSPTHLDLFSGIGGFALAARWAGFETIGFCEIDKYCQRVIAKNFGCKTLAYAADARCNGETREHERGRPLLPARFSERCSRTAPLFPDIRHLSGREFQCVTLLTGGFPCQPFSCAGKRRGKEDDRHLWPEMLRIITEARPAWVLGENVAGIIGMELDTVLSDLETIGYACRPFVIPACGVDARHRRNRVWIVANSLRERRQQIAGSAHGDEAADERRPAEYDHQPASGGENAAYRDESGSQGRNGAIMRECADKRIVGAGDSSLAYANGNNGHGRRSTLQMGRIGREGGDEKDMQARRTQWQSEPDVGRVAHGIPARVDRLRGLGNAIVPQVACQILKAIRGQLGAGTNTANTNV